MAALLAVLSFLALGGLAYKASSSGPPPAPTPAAQAPAPSPRASAPPANELGSAKERALDLRLQLPQRVEALRALAQAPDAGALLDVLGGLSDDQSQVRAMALTALERFPKATGVRDYLLTLAESPGSSGERVLALQLLGRRDDVASERPRVQALTRDPDANVVAEARRLVEALAPPQ